MNEENRKMRTYIMSAKSEHTVVILSVEFVRFFMVFYGQ